MIEFDDINVDDPDERQRFFESVSTLSDLDERGEGLIRFAGKLMAEWLLPESWKVLDAIGDTYPPEDRIMFGYAPLAKLYSTVGRSEVSQLLLACSLSLAQQVSGSRMRSNCLESIAVSADACGFREQAVSIWAGVIALCIQDQSGPSPQDQIDAAKALWGVAVRLAQAGMIERAQEIAKSISSPRWRTIAHRQIANIRKCQTAPEME